MFNAPWPALLIAGSIVASYAVQSALFADQGAVIDRWGLVPYRLAAGDPTGLFTHMLIHGGWLHALGNALFALVCAAPLARLMGQSVPRALALFAFYIVCGVLAGGLYAAFYAAAAEGAIPLYHPPRAMVLVGASGGVSGLMGAAARTLGQGGRLGPVFSRTAVGTVVGVSVANLVVGLLGFTPGLAEGFAVAWPVHIIGLVVGLFLFGPWLALFGAGGDGKALPGRAPQQGW